MAKYKKVDIIVFAVVILLHTLNQAIKNSIEIEPLGYLMKNHFNDFLGGLGIVAYIDFVMIISKYHLHISKIWIAIGIGFLCGLFWEFVTPLYNSGSVSDWLDIVAYAAGACTYSIVLLFFDKITE